MFGVSCYGRGDPQQTSCLGAFHKVETMRKAKYNSEARPFIWTTRLNASFLYDPNFCSAWPYLTLVPEVLGKHTKYDGYLSWCPKRYLICRWINLQGYQIYVKGYYTKTQYIQRKRYIANPNLSTTRFI